MSKGISIGIIWLVVINFFALVALNRVNLQPDDAYGWIQGDTFHQQKTWNPIDVHNHWDSYWYLSVVHTGYIYNPQGDEQLSNVAFFPLYPLLIKMVDVGIHNAAATGWLISSVFVVLSCGLLCKLVAKYHADSVAQLSVVFMLIFPTAFFFNGVYAESLFLFLSVATFYLLFEKKLWWAGVVGLLAALTRITGVFLFIPFLIEGITYIRRKEIKNVDILSSALIPAGTLGFFAYLYLRFNDALAYFHVQSAWGRSFSINAGHFYTNTTAGVSNLTLDSAFLLFGIIVTVFVYLQVRKSYAIYMGSVIAAAVTTGTLMSIGRILLVLFPAFIFLGTLKNSYSKFTWALLSTLLLGMYTLLFVNNYWAG